MNCVFKLPIDLETKLKKREASGKQIVLKSHYVDLKRLQYGPYYERLRNGSWVNVMYESDYDAVMSMIREYFPTDCFDIKEKRIELPNGKCAIRVCCTMKYKWVSETQVLDRKEFVDENGNMCEITTTKVIRKLVPNE